MESQQSEEVPLPIPGSLKGHMEDDCFWILSQHKLLKLPRKPNVEDILRQFYYHSLTTPSEDVSPALLSEVLDGIKIYFDFMTGEHLLYAPERAQFKATITEHNWGSSTHNRGGSAHIRPRVTNSLERPKLSENSCTSTNFSGNPWQPDQQKPQIEPTATQPNCREPVLMPSQVYGVEHLLRLFLKFPYFLSRAQLPSPHVQLLYHCFKELLAYISSRQNELFSEDNYEKCEPGDSGEEEEGVKCETPGRVQASSKGSTPTNSS